MNLFTIGYEGRSADELPSSVAASGVTTVVDVRDLPLIRKRNYQFVVLDLPPLSEGSSAVRMAGLADGMILVAEAERARVEVVQRAKESLQDADARLLGAVLNKRRFYIPAWLYRRV